MRTVPCFGCVLQLKQGQGQAEVNDWTRKRVFWIPMPMSPCRVLLSASRNFFLNI